MTTKPDKRLTALKEKAARLNAETLTAWRHGAKSITPTRSCWPVRLTT
jgi:hypothetical protein